MSNRGNEVNEKYFRINMIMTFFYHYLVHDFIAFFHNSEFHQIICGKVDKIGLVKSTSHIQTSGTHLLPGSSLSIQE